MDADKATGSGADCVQTPGPANKTKAPEARAHTPQVERAMGDHRRPLTRAEHDLAGPVPWASRCASGFVTSDQDTNQD
jgi:hypothetical protein